MHELYGNQLYAEFNVDDVEGILMPILEYYSVKDGRLIKDRVIYRFKNIMILEFINVYEIMKSLHIGYIEPNLE